MAFNKNKNSPIMQAMAARAASGPKKKGSQKDPQSPEQGIVKGKQ